MLPFVEFLIAIPRDYYMNYQNFYLVEFHEIDFILYLEYNIFTVFHEKEIKNMQVCFIGHRNLEKTDELISLLKKTIVTLINNGVTTFLFGSKSEFDNLSWEVVTELKKKQIINLYKEIKEKSINELDL